MKNAGRSPAFFFITAGKNERFDLTLGVASSF